MKRKTDEETSAPVDIAQNISASTNNDVRGENGTNEPGTSSSGPRTKKMRKKTSPLWNHFTIKVSDDNKGQFAYCNYCDKYRYDIVTKFSFSSTCNRF